MKKLILFLLPLMFIGCTIENYSESSNQTQKDNVSDFITFEVCAEDSGYQYILRDVYTDVLYYKYVKATAGGRAITPIMKADGSCLTYTEWKKRNKKANNDVVEFAY